MFNNSTLVVVTLYYNLVVKIFNNSTLVVAYVFGISC